MPPVSRLGFAVKSHIWLSQVIRRPVWGIGELGHIAPKVAWQSAGANRASCAARGGRPVIFAQPEESAARGGRRVLNGP